MRSGLGKGGFKDHMPHVFVLGVMVVALCIVIFVDIPTNRSVTTPEEGSDVIHVKRGRLSSRLTMDDIVSEYVQPEVSIEVNIPALELTLYENGIEKFRRPIAIGTRRFPTPEQESHIKSIEWNPWWYPPPAWWARNDKATPPGPRNPLGLVKMKIADAIMFHGTNRPWTVGRLSSHGCLRMFNDDATSIAWYLQQNFSEKDDPEFLKKYLKHRRRTYVVKLDKPIPVKLSYRPVVVRDGHLIFFPDHYNRFSGNRKAAILTELILNGFIIDMLDDEKIDELSNDWPKTEVRIPITDLLIDQPHRDFLSAPECS